MRIILLSVFALVFTLSSCIIRIGGLTSGRRNLSAKDSKLVGILDTTQNTPPINGFYPVNAGILKKYMRPSDTTMVYLWVPFCHGAYCYPLRTFVDYCKQHHYKLLIVADEYDMAYITPQMADDFPIFVLDYKYYGTNWRSKCRKRFVLDLLSNPEISDSTLYASKFYFAGGRFIKYKEVLD